MPIPIVHLDKEIAQLKSENTIAFDDAKCKVSEDCITLEGNTITVNASIDGVNYQCGRDVDSISIRMVFLEGRISEAFIFRSRVKCEKFIFGEESGEEASLIRRLLEESGFTRKQESLMLIVTDAVSFVIASLFSARPDLNATANEMIALRKKFFITGWRRRVSSARVHTMLRKAIDNETVGDVDDEMIQRQEPLRKLKCASVSSCSSSDEDVEVEPFFVVNGQLAFREKSSDEIDILFNHSMTECLLLECKMVNLKLASVHLRICKSKLFTCVVGSGRTLFDPLVNLLLANKMLTSSQSEERLMIEKMTLIFVRTAFNKVIPSRGDKIVMIDFTVNSSKIISDVKRSGWSRDITRFNTSQRAIDMHNVEDCVFTWKQSK